MDITYRPYIDPELEVLIERINPPRVCIDNDTYPDCTLVKVDSANKHGMLLEMVQVLTDIDLVISKSYISSDGGWFMDVFHVTDQLGNKITDERLIHYIQEGICASRRAAREPTSRTIAGPLGPQHLSTENTALEMTGMDRPGLMSEMSAALSDLGCHVSSAIAWTHNGRAAVILYVEDSFKAGPIMNARRAAEVQAHMEKVIAAHHKHDEQRSIKVTGSACGQTHTERRLHQLLAADKDYELCCSCCGGNNEDDGMYGYARCQKVTRKGCDGTHVRIENCKETGYSIVNIRSRDRPKLLFDTVCTLTDLEYVVSHAAISSKGSMAFQEYYVKHKDGYTVDSEDEKRRVIQCLIAATERRVSHGMRLDVCTRNKMGLLSDVTRVFRENGLSILRAEIGVSGEEAIGTFYVKDTSEKKVSPKILEAMRKEIGGTIVLSNKSSPDYSPRSSTLGDEERQSFSLGNLLWTQLERISSGFKPIRS